jgi:hypothetical protein
MSQYDDDMNRWDDEWTEIDVDKVIEERDLAVCVRIDGESIWFPKSQLDDWPDINKAGIVRMKTWLAEEKDLI